MHYINNHHRSFTFCKLLLLKVTNYFIHNELGQASSSFSSDHYKTAGTFQQWLLSKMANKWLVVKLLETFGYNDFIFKLLLGHLLTCVHIYQPFAIDLRAVTIIYSLFLTPYLLFP